MVHLEGIPIRRRGQDLQKARLEQLSPWNSCSATRTFTHILGILNTLSPGMEPTEATPGLSSRYKWCRDHGQRICLHQERLGLFQYAQVHRDHGVYGKFLRQSASTTCCRNAGRPEERDQRRTTLRFRHLDHNDERHLMRWPFAPVGGLPRLAPARS